MGLRICRSDSKCRVEFSDRVSVVAQSPEHNAQASVSLWKTRLEADRLGERSDGLIGLPEVQLGDSKVQFASAEPGPTPCAA